MNKISIQTAGSLDFNDIDGSLDRLKEAGFDAIDYNIDMFYSFRQASSGEKSSYFSRPIKEIIADNKALHDSLCRHGMSVGQMHAPFPFGTDTCLHGEEAVDVVEKCLAVAQYLGCPYVIVHPIAQPIYSDIGYEKEVNLAFYRQFIPFCKKYGVVICLENMFTILTRHVVQASCSDMNEACFYIDTLNAEAGQECFGFCLDTGHLNIVSGNMYRAVKCLGSRLKTLHIHENNGEQDLHAMPYTYSCYFSYSPESKMDWVGLWKALAEIGYEGTLNFETFGAMKIAPEPIWQAVRIYVGACGKYFAGEIEKQKLSLDR